MKYLKYYIIIIMSVVTCKINAASFTVEDMTMKKGDTKHLVIGLNNSETDLSGFQFKLYLPDGVSLATNGKNEFIYSQSERIEGYTLSVTALQDGSYQFIAYSLSSKAIVETSGTLLEITVSAGGSFARTGSGSLKGIKVTNLSSQTSPCSDVSFTVEDVVKEFSIDKIKYRYDGNPDTYTVSVIGNSLSGGSGSIDLVIPEKVTYKGREYTVTEVGDGAFASCNALKSVVLPSGIKKLSDRAFRYCSYMVSIQFPEGLEQIGTTEFGSAMGVFHGCSKLSEINFPSTLTLIGRGAFSGCSSLTSLILPNSVSTIGSNAFDYCSGLSNVVLSENLLTIALETFRGCTSLTSITIPVNVTSINDSAFNGCNSFTSVIVNWTEPISISSNTFPNSGKITLYVPTGCKAVYESANYWKNFKEIIEMEPESTEPTDVSTLTDAIYANAATGLKGGDCMLTICLKNEQSTSDYSFDLKLPEGVTLAKGDDDEYVYTLSTRHDGHTPSLYYNEATGVYSFAVQSPSSKEIKNNDGAIWTLKLNVAEDMEVGEYTIKIKNAKYSLTSGSEKLTMPEVTSILTIADYKKGDVNGDGVVDVSDAVATIDVILQNLSGPLVLSNYDVNADGDVDVMDVTKIVSIILADNSSNAPRRAAMNRLAMENVQIKTEGGGFLVDIERPEQYTAFQFDVEVPEGMSVTDVMLADGKTKHNLHFAKKSLNTYTVVGLSYADELLPSTAKGLIDIRLSGIKSGDVNVKNIMFVNPKGEKTFYNNKSVLVGTTGINGVSTSTTSDGIYDLYGRKLNVERNQLRRGIYIVNGKKVIIK